MFTQAETQFGLNFLKTLPAHNESFVFSPISIALVLSLVHTGARGKSKDQIRDSLLTGASDDQFVNHFSFINEKIRKGENGVEVYVANRAYLNKGFTANPSFLAIALKNYGADAKTLDFESLTAVREINTFVKEVTKAKITEIATKDSIKDAVALLINAIYFKGDWEDKFDGFSIGDKDFTTYSGHQKKVKFMKEYSWDRAYSSDDIFQVLHLSYADQRFQFSVFLPKERNTLQKALTKLDAKRFQDLLKGMRKTFMNTELPKFTIEKEVDIKKHLEALGITEIFTDNANLSGLAENVKISGGIHKAIIEVTENGTTASGITMAKLIPRSAVLTRPVEFHANHPFFFALTFEGHPIFMGVNEDGTVAAAATMAKAVPMSLRLETPVDFKADHPFLFALTYMNYPIFLGVFNG